MRDFFYIIRLTYRSFDRGFISHLFFRTKRYLNENCVEENDLGLTVIEYIINIMIR